MGRGRRGEGEEGPGVEVEDAEEVADSPAELHVPLEAPVPREEVNGVRRVPRRRPPRLLPLRVEGAASGRPPNPPSLLLDHNRPS